MAVTLPDEENGKTLESMLQEAKELAEQEFFGYQIVGRKLTEAEQTRSDALDVCIEYITEALEVLSQK